MKYDYIFCGFGLSAVLLLDALMENNLIDNQKVLIIEQNKAFAESKTWCFWEEGEGKWDGAVRVKWDKALFLDEFGSYDCLDKRGQYKMLDPVLFYEKIQARIAAYPQIKVINEKIILVEQESSGIVVTTESSIYEGKKTFNSILNKEDAIKSSQYPLLLQHFRGWYIKTKSASFDPAIPILMDFKIAQQKSTRFIYLLPLSEKESLIEFTLFSRAILEDKVYEDEIKSYLLDKGISDFEITKKESGIIPMTAFPFWERNTNDILHIGTAGGWTKSSTGYTFNKARNKSKELVRFLKLGKTDFRNFHQSNRFNWYDRLFVEVLYRNNEIGAKLFSAMFSKINPGLVLQFLDEKSTIVEEIKIISVCPKIPFLKAVLRLAGYRFQNVFRFKK